MIVIYIVIPIVILIGLHLPVHAVSLSVAVSDIRARDLDHVKWFDHNEKSFHSLDY